MAKKSNSIVLVERGGKKTDWDYKWKRYLEPQYCPFSSGETLCGTWCPAFDIEFGEDENVTIKISCFPIQIIHSVHGELA